MKPRLTQQVHGDLACLSDELLLGDWIVNSNAHSFQYILFLGHSFAKWPNQNWIVNRALIRVVSALRYKN
jgi:hypothetical protein